MLYKNYPQLISSEEFTFLYRKLKERLLISCTEYETELNAKITKYSELLEDAVSQKESRLSQYKDGVNEVVEQMEDILNAFQLSMN